MSKNRKCTVFYSSNCEIIYTRKSKESGHNRRSFFVWKQCEEAGVGAAQ